MSRTDQPAYQHFDMIYRDTLDAEPIGGEFTYDAVYLIALALAQAGENSPAAVRDHMGEISRPDGDSAVPIGVGESELDKAVQNRGADLDFRGASGAIDFDPAGDITATTYAIQEIQRGEDGLDFVDLELIDLP